MTILSGHQEKTGWRGARRQQRVILPGTTEDCHYYSAGWQSSHGKRQYQLPLCCVDFTEMMPSSRFARCNGRSAICRPLACCMISVEIACGCIVKYSCKNAMACRKRSRRRVWSALSCGTLKDTAAPSTRDDDEDAALLEEGVTGACLGECGGLQDARMTNSGAMCIVSGTRAPGAIPSWRRRWIIAYARMPSSAGFCSMELSGGRRN